MVKLKSQISFDNKNSISFKKRKYIKKNSIVYKNQRKPEHLIENNNINVSFKTEIDTIRAKIRLTVQAIFKKIIETNKNLNDEQLIKVITPYIEKIINTSLIKPTLEKINIIKTKEFNKIAISFISKPFFHTIMEDIPNVNN